MMLVKFCLPEELGFALGFGAIFVSAAQNSLGVPDDHDLQQTSEASESCRTHSCMFHVTVGLLSLLKYQDSVGLPVKAGLGQNVPGNQRGLVSTENVRRKR